MTSERPYPKRFSLRQKTRRNRGISTIISTIIIVAVLLVILVVASFVAMNILGLQMADSEFEQAKTNMQLLDDVIQDVSLRQGAGSYVQFNQVTGGIGIAKDTQNNITIRDPSGKPIYSSPTPSISLVYSGGNLVSGANETLRGSQVLKVSMDQPIGYLRVETGNGVKIRLDYNRVRVVPMGQQLIGTTTYNLTEITFLQFVQGNTTGSGTVNVRAQNIAINNYYSQYSNIQAGTSPIQLLLGSNPNPAPLLPLPRGDNVVVIVSVVVIQISMT